MDIRFPVLLRFDYFSHLSNLRGKGVIQMNRNNASSSRRTGYTLELGITKQKIYRSAYRHLERSTKKGAHLEVIVILESIMSDRIEGALSSLSAERINVSTLGALISKLNDAHPIDDDLRMRLRDWNRARGQVVHQMVKLTDDYSPSWSQRITFARNTAKEGVLLLKELRKVTDKIIRTARHGKRSLS